jgi:redox-sensitive bicupin YhaK (pirin superfamily)
MLAGRGLAHSERSTPAAREQGARIHGIQTWIATPRDQEDAAPHFEHHAAAAIPSVAAGGATLDVIAGEAFGVRSPVSVLSPTLYVHARLAKGARLELDTAHEERAIYVVEGEVQCDGRVFRPGTMVVLRPGVAATVSAVDSARAMIVGGAKLDGPRHIFWNFVASDKERIERAKSDWREGRFAKVIGDELDFVPLPE